MTADSQTSPPGFAVTMPHSSSARYYDEAYHRSFGSLYDALTKETVEFVQAKLRPPARIVDFGAGTGRLALPLARAGYTVVATDPCEEMLAVLRSKAATENLTLDTVRSRMQDEFPSPRFDFALCVFTVIVYLLDERALNASFQRASAALRVGEVSMNCRLRFGCAPAASTPTGSNGRPGLTGDLFR